MDQISDAVPPAADAKRRRATKEHRLELRITPDAKLMLERAAAHAGVPVSSFVTQASLKEAADTLADRRVFLLDPEAWAAFQAILDRPARDDTRLRAFLETPSLLEE